MGQFVQLLGFENFPDKLTHEEVALQQRVKVAAVGNIEQTYWRIGIPKFILCVARFLEP